MFIESLSNLIVFALISERSQEETILYNVQQHGLGPSPSMFSIEIDISLPRALGDRMIIYTQ